MKFFAEQDVSRNLCERIAALEPHNPIHTWAYVESVRADGSSPIALGLRHGTEVVSGCLGFTRAGYLGRELGIPSLPDLPAGDTFWNGLIDYARNCGVTDLSIDSYASRRAEIPELPGEFHRRRRFEFVLDLGGRDVMATMHKEHRRLTRRAQESGMDLIRTTDLSACQTHIQVANASMDRRRKRGDQVPEVEGRFIEKLLRFGAGELFQASLGGRVCASAVVLRASRGGYLHATGTDREGMKLGASHFMNYRIATTLQAEGSDTYNLGGTSELDSGLATFKSRFGSRVIALETVKAYLGPVWKRKLRSALRLMRDDPARLVGTVIGRTEQWVVFSARTDVMVGPSWPEGFYFRRLNDDDLEHLAMHSGLRDEQKQRRQRVRADAAYGVVHDSRLAHVSWLIRRADEHPVRLGLRGDEAEITACFTPSQFRGQGLYPMAIKAIAGEARNQGVTRIFMKTAHDNVASQRGIQKAGLSRCGTMTVYQIPFAEKEFVVRSFRRRTS